LVLCASWAFALPGDATCNPGSYVQSTTTSGRTLVNCNVCALGQFGGGGSATACEMRTTTCNSGKYAMSPYVTDTCTECPPGKYTLAGGGQNAACVPCTHGLYQSGAGSIACVGSVLTCLGNQAHCPTCPTTATDYDGPTSAEMAGCGDCPAGTFLTTLSSVSPPYKYCQRCPGGKYSDISGATSCQSITTCEAGRYLDTTISGAGGASAACVGCPPGKYNAQSSLACTECSEGQYTADAGNSACSGSTCTAAQTVSACGWSACTGQQSDGVCTQCVTVPPSPSPTPGDILVPNDCAAGKYYRSITYQGYIHQNCITCPKGKYSGAASATECTAMTGPSCPEGMTADILSTGYTTASPSVGDIFTNSTHALH
jgi:hypothetical protein